MRSLILLACLALAACASAPTVYGPALKPNAAGYHEQRIETDRYRVSFRGYSDLSKSQVEDRALRRAAELTVQDGYDWFRVVSRSNDQSGQPSGGTSVGVGGATGGRHSSVGVGVSIDLTPDRRTYESTLEVLLGKGAKPSDPDAYDARSILSRPLGG